MRLHLLQGIVAYHQNKRAEAKMLLEKAENELNELRVSWIAHGDHLFSSFCRASLVCARPEAQ